MGSDGREAFYQGVDTQGQAIRRPMSPHLQIYRFRLSMALSISNRLAGVASALGSGLAVFWLSALAQNDRAFRRAQCVVSHPLGRLTLVGWTVATLYHMVAGFRHLIWDAGKRFEKHEIDEDGKRSIYVTLGLSALFIGAVALLSSRRQDPRS